MPINWDQLIRLKEGLGYYGNEGGQRSDGEQVGDALTKVGQGFNAVNTGIQSGQKTMEGALMLQKLREQIEADNQARAQANKQISELFGLPSTEQAQGQQSTRVQENIFPQPMGATPDDVRTPSPAPVAPMVQQRQDFQSKYGLSPDMSQGQFKTVSEGRENLAKSYALEHPELKPSGNDDERLATTVYTPDYIKQVFPNYTDEQRALVKVGQIKSGVTTNNQATLNEDRDMARKNLEEDRKQRAEDRATAMRTRVVDRFNALANVKKNQSSIEFSDNTIRMLESENPIADSAMPTFMARASGEVGALSEADKAPFGGSKAILDRVGQIIKNITKGELTDENRAYLHKLAETMKKSALKNIDNAARRHAKQNANIGGYGKENEIYAMLNPGLDEEDTRPIFTDANGNKAYQNPDGTFEEIR